MVTKSRFWSVEEPGSGSDDFGRFPGISVHRKTGGHALILTCLPIMTKIGAGTFQINLHVCRACRVTRYTRQPTNS